MKKLITFIVSLFLLQSFSVQGQDLEEVHRLVKKEKYSKALNMINVLIKEDPDRATYYSDKAVILIYNGDIDGSFKCLDHAIKLFPDSLDLYYTRGGIYEATRQFEKAVDAFSKGYELSKSPEEQSKFLTSRGGTKMRYRDFGGAYRDLVLAVDLDSTNINALNNLAMVCDDVDMPDKILVYLEKIVAIDSTYVPGYINLGFRYQHLGEHEKAIHYFDKAVELAPNEPLAYSNRSYSKLKLNKLSAAMRDINKSLELLPSNSWAYKIRALIYIEKGDMDKACEDLNTALEYGYTNQYGKEVETLIKKNCKN